MNFDIAVTAHRQGTSMRRRARATMALAAALSGAAGLGMLGAGPAAADASSTTSAPATALGGYTLGSSAAGVSVFYEQPNFPIPATPTLEANLGYSTASFDTGPVGNANAAAVWPGSVVAGGGSQLALLFGPYIQQYFGPLAPTVTPLIPNFGPWPIQAQSAYPQGPPTASDNNGPLAMDSSATQAASTATSSLGMVGGPASESALPAGMITVQAIGSTAQDTVDALGNAVSEATATVHGIDIAGGLVHIGEVTSTATSSSDGNQAKVDGSSTVTQVTVAGESVTVDSGGLHAGGTSQNPLGAAVPSVNQILSTAGITLSLTNATDKVDAASGQRRLDGLAVKIDLSTYDQNFNKLMAMLPAQLTSGLSQLPVPSPYKQSVTIDFGWVDVNAAASPAFNADLGSLGSTGDSGVLSQVSSADSGFAPSAADLGTGTTFTGAGSGAAAPATSAGGSAGTIAGTTPV
ncbi:MAG: choice-of-anchor P family protein, partial [Acidimicrobiales bacterium]